MDEAFSEPLYIMASMIADTLTDEELLAAYTAAIGISACDTNMPGYEKVRTLFYTTDKVHSSTLLGLQDAVSERLKESENPEKKPLTEEPE